MATNLLNLPINIPWCQIAVTENMIDQRIGSDRFPLPWRSSMAISAYEPKSEDLPEEFADQKVTYLKITCSITGYQPTGAETDELFVNLDDLVADPSFYDILLRDYLACYGVLLNVSVLPLRFIAGGAGGSEVGGEDLSIYPHIIAFEPKVRDLYQAATESGEVLTASASKLATDKTQVNTEQSETGLSLSGGYQPGQARGGPTINAGLTHTWGETDQDSRSVQTDASRERRETQGTTTQISQMYNLLTGYHKGTNRATFLMLPRPNILQPTEKRTIVQGLRVMEGEQEFFHIVMRPATVEGLCVEASLDTGHFSEDAAIIRPDEEYDEDDFDFVATAHAKGSGLAYRGEECANIQDDPSAVQQVPTGYVVDKRKKRRQKQGDPPGSGWDSNHPGVADLDKDATPMPDGYNYQADDSVVTVSGTICGTSGAFGGDDRNFRRSYRVFIRSEQPINADTQGHAEITDLLIARRGLEVCFRSGEGGCPEIVTDPLDRPESDLDEDAVIARALQSESIVDESKIRISPALLTRTATQESRLPAVKELLRQIHHTMATSWRQPTRYPAGTVGYLESDYFKNRVMGLMPRDRLEHPLTRVEGLPNEVIEALGEHCTVAEALEMELSRFARKTDLSVEDAAMARRRLLGIRPKPSDDIAQNSGYSTKSE